MIQMPRISTFHASSIFNERPLPVLQLLPVLMSSTNKRQRLSWNTCFIRLACTSILYFDTLPSHGFFFEYNCLIFGKSIRKANSLFLKNRPKHPKKFICSKIFSADVVVWNLFLLILVMDFLKMMPFSGKMLICEFLKLTKVYSFTQKTLFLVSPYRKHDKHMLRNQILLNLNLCAV